MKQARCSPSAIVNALLVVVAVACTTPNPNYRRPGSDAAVDTSGEDGGGRACTAGAALRCDGMNLLRCNSEGTAEVSELCGLGCVAAERRCADVAPSNGLARFLDMANSQPDLNLGDAATINTDTGEVKVGGGQVQVRSENVVQSGGPIIRVLMVRSLTAKDVVVSGAYALAVVSSGEVRINGNFSSSARARVAGAGAFGDSNCNGQPPPTSNAAGTHGGYGGAGFGSPGGSGGPATNANGTQLGGPGGSVTGSSALVPLRGGCNGVSVFYGGGGGAIQMVSRTRIGVAGTTGVIAANGSAGGGSGGGILLEAPIVEVSGRVVANGAGGDSDGPAEDGRLDATPAAGGLGDGGSTGGRGGGRGAAGNLRATDGDGGLVGGNLSVYGSDGGGGVGRIRINNAPGGLYLTGLLSPNPSLGEIATR